ncbi:MAG: GlsB/YeaQ/YmgE family stress response membrane protein [Acidobacteriota bacterium]|nr:GlsB/YeaQ/YmgE family stress response membrane protein [Acidobacteriota bacterium]
MLAILGWIVFGLIAGLIAKAIMPGRDPGGALITIALGIVGALIGGFVGQSIFGRGGDGTSDPGFLMSLVLAVVGAILVLAVYRLATGRSLRA